jgi:H+/Cl- antiporter ClcA
MIKDLWEGPRYTEDELMARLKFFIGMILALTLFGIVFVVLYSLIFVTQPMNGMSPVDNKFFELIIPIATFLTGTLSGIMLASGDKEAQREALKAANKGWDKPPSPTPMPTVTLGSNGSVSIGPSTGGNQVTVGFGGKAAPPQQPFPEL